MPHRQQLIADLDAVEQRIKEGQSYIHRMEELVHRMRAKNQNTAEQLKIIGEMSATLNAFQESRERLLLSLEHEGPPASR